MRVGASLAPSGTSVGERQVAPERTPVDREQIRSAIRRALTHTDGAAPSERLVDVLTAHASLETASGGRMYNFNFGGIKGHAPSGGIAVCRTREVLDGREVVVRDGFRAYRSLDEGALDYVRTMKSRFGAALAPAARGDLAGFAGALKRAGYYTASEADYARGLATLIGASPTLHGTRTAPSFEAPSRDALGLSSVALSRVTDALDAERMLDALGSSPAHAHRAESDDDDA